MTLEFVETDRRFMGQALDLARQGRGRTSPNPMVGAVVVKDGEVIGAGYHAEVGGPHAEVVALRACCTSPRDATLYVTLEPCCHQGRTPPCVPTLIEAGLRQVVVGLVDPFHRVQGRGIEALRAAGLAVRMVEDRTLLQECARENEIFIKHATTGLPFVTLKYAMTADGKIATRTGHSQWISGQASRQVVHEQRTLHDAVMVGSGTALLDNPRLTARGTTGRDPVKVIVDSKARLPVEARVLQAGSRVIVATAGQAPPARVKALQGCGVQVWECPGLDGRVDLSDLMLRLAREQITSVLMEGGGTLLAAAVEAGLVDRAIIFIAPVLVGGREAPSPVEGTGVATMAEGLRLHEVEWQACGTDMMLRGYLHSPAYLTQKGS